jgi:hypothetical protein
VGLTRICARVFVTVFLFTAAAPAQETGKVLRSGWYPWDPYQYLVAQQDIKRLTGLDVQLVRAVFAQIGHEVSYEEVSWKQHQIDIQNGVRDIAAGAFKNADAIRADANNPFLKGTFYAEVALIWGLALSLFLIWYANLLDYKPGEISLAVVVTLLGGLLTRMAVFYFRVKRPIY